MRLKRIVQQYRDYFVFSGLVMISLLLIFSNQNRQVETVKLWMAGLMGIAHHDWTRVTDYFHLSHENQQLLQENTRLALENNALQEMRLENERLRKMLDFKKTMSMELLPAKVIGRREHGLVHSLALDVGVRDKVRRNMPLVVPAGLVGKVYRVGDDACLAQLLLDRNFRVSAVVQRSRVRGIVSWRGGDVCLLNNVARRADVEIGDLVVTSGYGEIYPAGLPIGKVVKLDEDPRSLFLTIKLKPSVDFNKIEEVFIIRRKIFEQLK
ncbi:MAG: rod shape-determining protein MreC [Calditrichaeota bacterium]|nr:rod shape-determining protein MreC [Calditrichota bacterium]